MKRSNASEIKIKNPGMGVITRAPSNLPIKKLGQFWTVAKNVRAKDHSTETAPGYERIVPKGTAPGETEPTNMVVQATLSSGTHDRNKRELTVIGTSDGLYAMAKVSQDNPCHPDNLDPNEEPPTSLPCEITFGFMADGGTRDDSTQGEVRAQVVDQYPIDFMLCGGDMMYDSPNPNWNHRLDLLEEVHCYYWSDFIKGYAGPYAPGPVEQRWFPQPNNHEFTDWPSIDRYDEVFTPPPDAVGASDQGNFSYKFKRGPCEFFVLDLYGPCCKAPAGVGQLDVTSTSPVAVWLQTQLAASDASWKIVMMGFPPYSSRDQAGSQCLGSSPYNGYKDLRWPFSSWGADAVLAGDTHFMEHIQQNGVNFYICGAGGATLDSDDGQNIQTENPGLGATSLFINTSDWGLLRCEASHTKLVWTFHSYLFGDPLYSYTQTRNLTGSEVCYIGSKAKQVDQVVVRPKDPVSMEEGQQWPFKCIAYYVDGDWDDVTDQATWSSSDPGVAAVGSSGVVTGIGAGSASITATYQGKSDLTSITIKTPCVGKPKDYFLVLECSAALEATSSLGKSRLDYLKDAVKGFIDSLSDDDRVGIIAFKGNWATQSTISIVNIGLTNDFNSAKAAVDSMSPSGSNSLGKYVAVATQRFEEQAREDADQHMIIFIDTLPNISTGGDTSNLGTSQIDAMNFTNVRVEQAKDAGICMFVIHLDIYEEDTWLSQIEAWGDNPSNVVRLTSAEQLYGTFIQLNNTFCALGCKGNYLVEPPEGCGGGDPRLNYASLTNWNVVQNEVDLIGKGNTGVALYDVYNNGDHTQGLYIDLAGSGPSFYGKIEEKTGHNLTANDLYRITFKLAGNWRQSVSEQSVRVQFGTLLDDTITITDYQQLFTEYSYEVRPSVNVTGAKLSFELLPSDSWSAVGILLDEVLIEDLSTPATLLDDDFDTEAC